ncbi:MAG: hypothetical protein COB51_14470, partial [Moraxellaceae bacterium]
ALFISESDLARLKKTTQLNLQPTKTSIRLGLTIVVYRTTATKNAISNCVATFDDTVNSYLRVEKWRATE